MMIELLSVSKPQPAAAIFESMRAAEAVPQRAVTPGRPGSGAREVSRSLKFLAAKGKTGPLRERAVRGALESIIGPTDDRVRVLDTELAPWRMVCALRVRGQTGAGAIGTGWFVGPKTLLTAGHCVHSTQFFGGWASSIEVSPGRNGGEFPFRTVRSTRFSSVNRWVEAADPDFDIGCIHLDDPLGDEVGWFSVGALSPEELEGFLVNVSGYPGDRGGGTEQYHHRNRILRVTERRLFYDVDTFGGQSGAPVWIHETDTAPPLAIGIHAYGVGGSADGLEANSAPRIIPGVLDQIRTWVEADGGWPPGS
jgi:V8-like Glu-specific endopeptidase